MKSFLKVLAMDCLTAASIATALCLVLKATWWSVGLALVCFVPAVLSQREALGCL